MLRNESGLRSKRRSKGLLQTYARGGLPTNVLSELLSYSEVSLVSRLRELVQYCTRDNPNQLVTWIISALQTGLIY